MRWLLVFIPLVACGDPFSAPGAVPFDPPPAFAELWQQMEACSGTVGDMRRIQWYLVPDEALTYDGKPANGVWTEPHTIYVTAPALAEPLWGSPPTVVPHEMLHDLLQRGDHPPVFQACGV